MFGGVQELNIDSKGRLAIPAKFRELLLRHYSPLLVTTLGARTHLWLYPEPNWREVERQLLNLPTAGKPVLAAYQNLVLHNAETLELDSAGRILLPAHLRQKVEFDKDVTLVGRSNRLELWGSERWNEETNRILDLDPDVLADELSQTDLRL